jgi:hypothetical protein
LQAPHRRLRKHPRDVGVPPRVCTYTADSDVLPVMNSRLRLLPPKHTLEMISGMRIQPMRLPSGANTCTPSKPSPTQPMPAHTLPSSSQRMPSAKPLLPLKVISANTLGLRSRLPSTS